MSNSAPSRAIVALQNGAIVGVAGLAGYGVWYAYKATDGFQLSKIGDSIWNETGGALWCKATNNIFGTGKSTYCAQLGSGAFESDVDPNNIGLWTVLGASVATAIITYKN